MFLHDATVQHLITHPEAIEARCTRGDDPEHERHMKALAALDFLAHAKEAGETEILDIEDAEEEPEVEFALSNALIAIIEQPLTVPIYVASDEDRARIARELADLLG
ncbi:hypothetical protein HYS28_00020 [Candidatus Uhrbacteria bacterium]|nr:hypothetical protein [Candidatus Uhrbacteria bacterium]